MRITCTILFIMLILPAALSAQAYEGTGRDPEQFNTALSTLSVGSVVTPLNNSGTGTFNNWCTSFLAPEGEKPKKTDKMDEDLREYEWAVDNWSCMYSPQQAQDGNPKTAWCEGAPGDGIGEVMISKVNVEKPIKIWAGFGSSNSSYLRNSRPKKILVSVLIADSMDVTQSGEIYYDCKVVTQETIELKDRNKYQELPIKKVRIPKGKDNYTFIAIKILSVYKGTRYEDTLISEVTN